MHFSKFNSKSSPIIKSSEKPSYLQNHVTFDGFFKIVIVLDESGSMENIKNDIIKSINDLILEQKQVKERPAIFSLIKFNNSIKKVIMNEILQKVDPLTQDKYIPNGSTALYDAIGETINQFNHEKDVLMVIVTDGEENASRKYTREQINKMIDEKKDKNNWTYVYLSSDLNTKAQGDNIGLIQSATASNCTFSQHKFGEFIGSTLNTAISNYRKTGTSVQSQIN